MKFRIVKNVLIKLLIVPIAGFCAILFAQDNTDNPFRYESNTPPELRVDRDPSDVDPDAGRLLSTSQSTMLLAVRITSDHKNFGHLLNLGIETNAEILEKLVEIAWQAIVDREEAYATRVASMCEYFISDLDRSLSHEARVEKALKISEGDNEVERDLVSVDAKFRQAVLDTFGDQFYQEILSAKDRILESSVSYKSITGRQFFELNGNEFLTDKCQEN